MSEVTIRDATRAGAATIVRLIRELAAYEKLLDEARASEADILRDGFGGERFFECLLAEIDGEAVGFALFFPSYSTFEGRPGLYLEDIFIAEPARGKGIGTRLMARLAAIALARGYRRLDLSVLHWNPARDFYRRLGIEPLEGWLPYRIAGEAMRRLARTDRD